MKRTLVTGLWDLNRESLSEGWSRPFSHYIEKFKELLKTPDNMIIFGNSKLYDIVYEVRSENNTQFIHRELDWFKNNEYFDLIQKIRTNESWYNSVGWLKDSTQASLEYYNPLIMSKVFLLNDARLMDKFNSNEMYWIDAGITNTVHGGYFTHDLIIDKLPNIDKLHFIAFKYQAENEIHGFNYEELCNITNNKPDSVCRGGFFGGKVDLIEEFNGIYYNLLMETLNSGLMGTEESLFTILSNLYPELFYVHKIPSHGLISSFFEDVKNKKIIVKNDKNVGLYVLSFNSPNQFESLINSILFYDKNFIEKCDKYLIDNSTDLTTTQKYLSLCKKYNFKHIKKDNIGITGGRQYIAEHFNETDLDYYIFFEDDMLFYTKSDTCRFGFNRRVKDLLNKTIKIIENEQLDFLKLNFTEFYSDNSKQIAWYNVTDDFRKKRWSDNHILPKYGLSKNTPFTDFKYISSYKDIPYAVGEIFLCNWPVLFNKKGNYKCYIKTKFKYPTEQTIMSYVYQETVKENIKSGVLLLTPTEHNRFEHYNSELRKEN